LTKNENITESDDIIKRTQKTILNTTHITEFYFRFLDRVFSEIMNEIEEDDTVNFHLTREITNEMLLTDDLDRRRFFEFVESITPSELLNFDISKISIETFNIDEYKNNNIKKIIQELQTTNDKIKRDISKLIKQDINTLDKVYKNVGKFLIEESNITDAAKRKRLVELFENVSATDALLSEYLTYGARVYYSTLDKEKLTSILEELIKYYALVNADKKQL